MIFLEIIGGAALLFGVFYLGIRVGANYMVEITTLAAKYSGVDPLIFADNLDLAKRRYQKGERA